MPDIDEGSDSNTIFETCTSLLRKTLSCETCYTYSSDNTSSMVGKNKTILKLIRYAQGESPQKIFDTSCPCHLTHAYMLKRVLKLCQYKLMILLLTCFTILKEV